MINERQINTQIGQAINLTKDLIFHNWQGQPIPVDIFVQQLINAFPDILSMVNHIQKSSLNALKVADNVSQPQQPMQPQPYILSDGRVAPPFGVNQR